MRPTVEEQLSGIRRVLEDVVVPQVDDPYAADVLAGALAALDVLAEAGPDVVAFTRWDTTASGEVLAMVGVEPPAPPADPLDLAALALHHEAVRTLLEAAVPAIRQDPDADRASGVVAVERPATDGDPAVTRRRDRVDATGRCRRRGVAHQVEVRRGPLEQTQHERIAVGEVPVERADADTGALGDQVDRCVDAVLGDDCAGGIEDAFAVGDRIGALGATACRVHPERGILLIRNQWDPPAKWNDTST